MFGHSLKESRIYHPLICAAPSISFWFSRDISNDWWNFLRSNNIGNDKVLGFEHILLCALAESARRERTRVTNSKSDWPIHRLNSNRTQHTPDNLLVQTDRSKSDCTSPNKGNQSSLWMFSKMRLTAQLNTRASFRSTAHFR